MSLGRVRNTPKSLMDRLNFQSLCDLQVEEDDLDEAFRPFGELTSLHLPLDRTEATVG